MASREFKVVGGEGLWYVIVIDWAGATVKVGPFVSRARAEEYVRESR